MSATRASPFPCAAKPNISTQSWSRETASKGSWRSSKRPDSRRRARDVLQQVEEPAPGAPEHLDVLALVALERRSEQQIRHAEDRVQRRANLVAHGRDEGALGARGLLRRV
jgi:hypothetical protein